MIIARTRLATVCLTAMILSGFGFTDDTLGQQTRGAYVDSPKLPGGPVGQRIRELIDTINANDGEKVRAFFDSAATPSFRSFAPMERHIGVFLNLYRQSEGFEFAAIRSYPDAPPSDETVVILRNKLTEGWDSFSMTLESDAPHRIAGLQFAPARPPSFLKPEGKLSHADLIKKIERFVAKLAKAEQFSGTVLLAKDGKVLFKKAYGLASRRFNVPNRIDTKFNLGSMNKMFTGVAIMQLVEQGKLSLDDPLSQYLSTDWLPRAITDKIKIKHLLTHTSGLGSYFNDVFDESSRAKFRALDDYKPLVAVETLSFEPGTDWAYSNTGMFLLGVVIEKVTGQSYFDYVLENIHRPAGMINSDCYEMDQPVPNLAIGYSQEPGPNGPVWTNNLYKHVVKGGPAGGGFSTVEDLLRFDIALREHKLLNRENTEMVWSAKPEMNSPRYGFGFGISGEPGNRIVGHSGGFSGINSNLDIYLDSGYTVAAMSNYDGGASVVCRKIKQLLDSQD